MIFASVIVLMILYIGLVLHQGEWLIAPFVGIAATLISSLYSQTIYPATVCESTMISQGYPYPWIHLTTIPPSARCIFYYGPTGNTLAGYSLAPNPLLGYIWFLADAVFYTLLVLAIIELFAAARRSQSNPSGFHV